MSMQRKPLVVKVSFDNSSTGVAEAGPGRALGGLIDMSQFSFGAIHASPGLDGAVLSITDRGPWGDHVILQKTLAAEFNALTTTELLALSSAMAIVCSLDDDYTGELYFKMKS